MRRFLIILLLLGAGMTVALMLNRRAGRAPTHESDALETERTSVGESPRISVKRASFDGGVDGGGIQGDDDAFHFDLADLDFEALRSRTPDSLYWLMAAPTDDPAALEVRARAREERNHQYGKVVSNTATVDEIHDYYAYRRKLSEDYIEVLQLILDEHGDELSDRDASLFELTIAMHAARLAEIPSKLDDALRRKAEYDRTKEDWREQQRNDAEGDR